MVLLRLRTQAMGEFSRLMASDWSTTLSKWAKLKRSFSKLRFTNPKWFASNSFVSYFIFLCVLCAFIFSLPLCVLLLFVLFWKIISGHSATFLWPSSRCSLSLSLLHCIYLRHWGHCLIFGWGWWAYSCVRLIFVLLLFWIKIFVKLFEHDFKIFGLSQFLLSWLLRNAFQSSFYAHTKPCGKMVVNTFGWEIFPSLSFSYFCELWELRKQLFELSLIFWAGKTFLNTITWLVTFA